MNHPELKSLAHVFLDRVQSGEYIPDPFAVGSTMIDGSSVLRHPEYGWIIETCLPACGCLKGREARKRAKLELTTEPSYRVRHRDGLVEFG